MNFARIRAVTAGVALASVVVLASATPTLAAPAERKAAPAAAANALTTPVTGHFTDALNGAGTVTGTFTPTRFLASGGQLVSRGVLTTTLVDSAGQTVGTNTQTVTLPAAQQAGGPALLATCQILNLVLGPLDLNLLGLVVHLDTVHLNITAQSGPGELVGNLLCAIAGLLDGVTAAQALAALLNAILALLNL